MKLSTFQKITLARIASKFIRFAFYIFGHGDIIFVKRGGINWILDLKEGIDFSIYLLGGFEPRTLRLYNKILNGKKNLVVFDIGANIGAHTLPLAKIVLPGGGEVHAFEPTVWAFEKLEKNLSLNPDLSSGVFIQQAILLSSSDSSVPKEIYSSWPLMVTSSLHSVHCGDLKNTEGTKAMTLNNYVAQSQLKRVDFIKLDVDGYESDVLNGSWEVIDKFKPTILLEWAPYLFCEKPNLMREVLDRFIHIGYDLLNGSNGKYISNVNDLEKIVPVNGSVNIFLFHSSSKNSIEPIG
jgi:FkbM family methyltransferase